MNCPYIMYIYSKLHYRKNTKRRLEVIEIHFSAWKLGEWGVEERVGEQILTTWITKQKRLRGVAAGHGQYPWSFVNKFFGWFLWKFPQKRQFLRTKQTRWWYRNVLEAYNWMVILLKWAGRVCIEIAWVRNDRKRLKIVWTR